MEYQPNEASKRHWELLSDRSLEKTIENLQGHINFYHQLYVSLTSIDATSPELNQVISNMVEEMNRLKVQLVPFIEEQEFRDLHNISVSYEYKTPSEEVQDTENYSQIAGIDSLMSVLKTRQETEQLLIGNLERAKYLQKRSREMRIISTLEDANADILSLSRSLETHQKQIAILEKEIAKRKTIAYRAKKMAGGFMLPIVRYIFRNG